MDGTFWGVPLCLVRIASNYAWSIDGVNMRKHAGRMNYLAHREATVLGSGRAWVLSNAWPGHVFFFFENKENQKEHR